MIASWMLYAFLVSALVTVAALALDRVAQASRWPNRAVWLGALLLSVAWPLGSIVSRLMPASVSAVHVTPFTITLQPVRIIADSSRVVDIAALVDKGLLALWCAASALLLLRLLQGVLILQRNRGAWASRTVDGTAVRVSPNVGPAVVGLRSMDVVLPEWILHLDAPLRAIVLRHEEEHRMARDPYLLFAAAVAVALMPWNAALWIQARRLRLAIELDCDARVLRAHPSHERYGLLMLTIAQRRSVAPTLFAPMLSESTSQLERRILAMRTKTQRLAKLTVCAGMAVAFGVLTFAASLRAADATFAAPITKRLLPTIETPAPIAAAPARLTGAVRPMAPRAASLPIGLASRPQEPNPAPRYPDILIRADIQGSVVVEFATDAAGAPVMPTLRVLSSSHDLFTAAVRNVLPTWRLAPNVVAHIPFVFQIESGAASTDQARARRPRVTVDGIDAIVVVGVRNEVRELDAVRNEVRDLGAVRTTVSPDTLPATGRWQHTVGGGTAGTGAGPTPMNDNQTYFEFQVEKQVSPHPGNIGPRYPDSLRVAKVEGEVLAQFVVDTAGHAEMDTFKVLKSTHEMFTNAVKATLPNMVFYPAEVGGKRVKQLVQMPFQFNLTK